MIISIYRCVLALALVTVLCAPVVGGGSLASEIAGLAELHSAGSLTAEEFSDAKKALIIERSRGMSGQPLAPATTLDPGRRQLQQQGGAPLPPPSGACPDVTGLQQALDAATARISALEVYTDVSAAPRGMISMWSGVAETIPQGWALCDGTNGTPDLRDKFVLGASETRPVASVVDADHVVTTLASACSCNPQSGHCGNCNTYQNCLSSEGYTQQPYAHPENRQANCDSHYTPSMPAQSFTVMFIMRLDVTCCVCHCSDANPTQPVPVVVPYGVAPDQACRGKCADESTCGQVGGHFAEEFSSACV